MASDNHDSDFADTDIAIVGIGIHAPGARDYRAFWRNLQGGVESIRQYTDEELLAAGEDPANLRRPNYVRAGAPLTDLETFDGEFFGFSPKESAILDPQHRHFLETAWEALEDAGHPPETIGGPVGLFAGCGMGSYFYFNICTNPELVSSVGMFLLRHTGNDKDFLSTRASFLFNLTGPSVNVQTACSTSLVAVHLACQSLLAGECDFALAGGTTIEVPHRRGYLFKENEILSPDGHCHAFDHQAKGTVFGSGAGVVVLRPLKAALKDGDHIHAVIRGSAINNDGAGKAGYLAPSVDGQAAAVVEALGIAGVNADSIGYIECHGTGTYLGDPIEVAALTRAFRQSTDGVGFCGIGSVKTNIGHTDTAAGVIGLAKAALSLEHGQIPPSLNFERPNPTIDFAGSPFYVNASLRDWKRSPGQRRRAGVNSLGVGGTNAHVVLEEPPSRPAPSASKAAYQLLCLSARNRAALDEGCERLAAHLQAHPELSLADVAYTLKVGRRAFGKRRVLAAADRDEAIALLRGRPDGRVFNHAAVEGEPALYFMLPGGGAQYPNMARGLYESEPLFRQIVDEGLGYLQSRIDYDAKAVLFPPAGKEAEAATRYQKPSVQLPAIFIIEYALAKLLLARGITPRGLIGHSLGENTAAALAEVFTFEQGVGLVHLRGTLFDSVPAGGMLSVPMPREQLEPLLAGDPHLDLACINSPGLCVVSGPKQPLAAFQAELAKRDVQAQRINIDIAAHSRMLEAILEPFRAYLKSLPLRAPKLPFISNRSGTWITPAEATDPEYWVRHLRHTVHFAEGVRTLASDKSAGVPVFLEVGPGKTLGSLAKQNPAVNAQNVVSSLRHPEEKVDDRSFFQTVLGRLWALGTPLSSETLWPGETRRRLPLPTYAFQGQRYWIDPGKAVAAREAPGLPVKIEDRDRWFWAPAWRRLDPAGDAEDEQAGNAATPAAPSWLVFLDETGVGAKLVAELRAQNQEVITVQAGDAFYKVSDREYWLSPEQGAEGYQALVHDILASGRAPSRIVHLWLLTEGESFRPGSSFFHRNQERGFYSLLFLAQALSGQDYPRPLHINVVSAGMQKLGSEPLAYPDMSTVLGPVKVMPREMPGVTCSSIDLPAIRRPETLSFAGALERVQEMVCWAAGERGWETWSRSCPARWVATATTGMAAARQPCRPSWRRSLRRCWRSCGCPRATTWSPCARTGAGSSATSGRGCRRCDEGAAGPVLRQGGVYMITGGLGGIGAAMSRLMARELKARLVLLARTPLPDRSEWARFASRNPNDPATARIRVVEQLEAAGAEVMVVAGDVADADRMTEVLAEVKQRFGALHGVIHAAGVLDDGLIPTKRQSQIEGVFGPKVHGTLVLDQVLRDEPLDFFVLFSSTSAAIASAGQVDYVAANTFLNNFARQARTASGGSRKVVSVGWGIWSEVGMAASAARKMGLHTGTEAADLKDVAVSTASYSLFQEKRVQPRRGGVLGGTLQAKRTWMLDEHRTAKQRAVLPGTGYLELLRAAVREMGETGPFEIEDLFFFRPLEVADDAAVEFRVRLQPADEGYKAEIQTRHRLSGGENNENGRVEGTGPGRGQGWLLHAQANLRFGHVTTAPDKLDLRALDARCPKRTAEDPRGLRSKQEEHLHFGPRWRVLHQACYGNGEALGRLSLPEKFRSDLSGVASFGLHPALLDLATGFALPLAPGYQEDGSKDLWVPLSYKRVKVHADLIADVQSWVRLSKTGNRAGFVSFDVTIAAPDGRVLVEIEGFTMRRLAESDFAAPKPLSASDLEPEGQVRERELSAAEAAFQHGLSQGITPAEGWRALKRVLAQVAAAEDPARDAVVLVSSMDLKALIHQAGQVSAAQSTAEPETKFARPQLESEYLAPRTEIEKTLVGFWEGLLGVNQIGVRDSFFELGGHSLIAVRLFAKIRKTYDVDYPISVLFEAPTIEACARLIAQTVGDQPAGAEAAAAGASAAPAHKTRYTHLVPMQSGSGSKGDKLPFFLVAGMFGNVLNLRHLAELVGSDRPFYGLQARGLYGDHQPHETFEEMARDYIAELRTVQPHGPYLLGGFSGGGITAYEMARQLAAEGESVPLIVMLDTPLPKDDPLTLRDKLAIHQQNWGKQGPRYALEWWKAKQSWKKHLAEREEKRKRQVTTGSGHDFHSHVIEAAFYGAVARYDLQAMPLHIALFRPRLRPTHQLGPGRAINADRRRIYHDNGWAPFVRRVEVFEMPGDHDSMVLEPNVRVLAARMRDSLDAAETSQQAQASNGPANRNNTSASSNGNNTATTAEPPSPRPPSPAAPV